MLAFGVNKDIYADAPTSVADLMDAALANDVAISGDPRMGNSTMVTVCAAGVTQGGAAGADALNKDIGHFKGVKESRNYVPVNGTSQNLAQGATPIYCDWIAICWRCGAPWQAIRP